MAVPTFVAAGTYADGVGTSLTPSFPAGLSSGDLLVLHISLHSATLVSGTPTGFTQVYSDVADSVRQDVWTKTASGSESGTLTVNFDGSAYHIACIYALRGGTSLEASNVSTFDNQTAINQPSMTTLGADRLCVALVNSNTQQTGGEFVAFTGTTGGTWVEASENGQRLQIQTADKAASGTVSGGSMTLLTTDAVVHVFAVIATGGAGSTGYRNLLLTGVG